MPLYEYRKNAMNFVSVPKQVRQEIVSGTGPVLTRIISMLRETSQGGRPAAAAFDGWYGVDWVALRAGLRDEAAAQGLALEIASTAELYRSAQEIEAYRKPFVTDDPSFGRVNSQGVLEHVRAGVADLVRRELPGLCQPHRPAGGLLPHHER